MGVSSGSSTAAISVALGGGSQTVTAATSGTTTVAMAGASSSVSSSGTGAVTVTAFGATGGNAVTGQSVTTTGSGAASVTFGAGATSGTVTLSASAADTVLLPSGTYLSSLTLTGGTQTGVVDTLEIADKVTAINISAASVSGFERIDLDSANATVFNVTMTPTQLAQFTGTNLINGTDDVITLSTTGTITGQPVLLNYVLANGSAGNTFNANSATLSISVTGGDAASTYNFGATLNSADTITGTAGSDFLNVTGTAGGSSTVTAIETINVNYATSATFTTGAITPGVASTITAAGSASTATATIAANLYVPTTSLTIIDGPGSDVITAPASDAYRALTTITLSSGGSDTVVIPNAGFSTSSSSAVTINNFTTGITAAADVITVFDNATQQINGLLTYTAATNGAIGGRVVEINAAVGTVTSFSATDAGQIETLIATAVGTAANAAGGTVNAWFIVYGSGALADKAALVQMLTTTTDFSTLDLVAGSFTVEVVGIFNGVTADSFVTGNFA